MIAHDVRACCRDSLTRELERTPAATTLLCRYCHSELECNHGLWESRHWMEAKAVEAMAQRIDTPQAPALEVSLENASRPSAGATDRPLSELLDAAKGALDWYDRWANGRPQRLGTNAALFAFRHLEAAILAVEASRARE